MDGLNYLCVPYSNPDPAVRQRRFEIVNAVAARLINEGLLIYSPISHSHHIATQHGLDCGWEFWKRHDEYMLSLCSRLLVLQIDGWRESVGVQAEIRFALATGIEIVELEYAE